MSPLPSFCEIKQSLYLQAHSDTQRLSLPPLLPTGGLCAWNSDPKWSFLSGLHQPRNVHIRIGFDQIWLKMYSKRIGVENTRTFFFSLSSLREGGLNFFLWRGSKGAGTDPIPCLRRPTKEISVLKLDRSSLATKGFCTQGGSEFRDILYA